MGGCLLLGDRTAHRLGDRTIGAGWPPINKSALVVFIALTALGMSALRANGQVVNVPATANIFGAGHTVPPAPGGGTGGTLPPVVSIPAGTSLVVTFPSVTGTVSTTPGYPNNGDGNAALPTNISSYGGISGIIHTNRFGFLIGVFIDDNEPVDPAPARLTYTAPVNFTSLAAVLGQTFFIGDGVTETGGVIQQFLVPQGATRLFLGFADANGYAGLPGEYQDNSGSLTVSVDITGVPEPSSMILAVSALIGGWLVRRRRGWPLSTQTNRRALAAGSP